MAIPSVMTHDFSRSPKAEIPRSSFHRTNGYKTTFDSGYLIPFYWDEVLPGDTCSLSMQGFARLATPLHPFMDNVAMNTFFFFVPQRLVQNNFQKMMGEQEDPGDSIDFTTPQMVSTAVTGYLEGSIFDYFGLPTGVPGLSHSALPLRAYNLIWNAWFRDQNLQDSVLVSKDDGPDLPSEYALLRRGKRHDYFSSSLPWPQKGDAVNLPLGTTAPIQGLAVPNAAVAFGATTNAKDSAGDAISWAFGGGATAGNLVFETTGAGGNTQPKIFANLSEATAATINQLRQAFQVQKVLERDARGGTRYTEIVRAHFNVTSPDARLQRPEYLGGGQSWVNLHAVPQTSSSDTEPTPQGNLAAYGVSNINGHSFTKSFTEHGFIIGLVSVRSDLTYQQGLSREWSRLTRYDYYLPALAMIGEQAVLNKEIYAQGSVNPTADAAAWGYQERWAEMRYKQSIVTGAMRSNAATSLDTWHLALDFASLPALNAAFIEDNPPIERVIAVPSEPQFILDCLFKANWARPMPMYGVPGLIDHF